MMSVSTEVKKLELEYEEILNQPHCSSLKSLLEQKSAISYRISHLNKVFEQLHADMKSYCIGFQSAVSAFFDLAIKLAFPEHGGHTVNLNIPSKSDFGDLQCNSAMRLSKEFQGNNYPKNPNAIADAIIKNLPKNDLIERVEIAGPGFINICISRSVVATEVQNILSLGVRPPKVSVRRVIIDMSSPNIAKEMHVGHLRSTIIGESIGRLLQFLGHEVLKLNHIGDWGTQFGMLIVHLQEMFPATDEVPPIKDLQVFYKEAKKRFDEEADFKQRAYNAVVQLQCYDAKHVKAWEQICNISRIEFNKVYERLDVKDLVERGESFYQSRMLDLIRDLEAQGMLTLEDGRKLFWAPDCEVPLTMVKSDGGFTYDTSDMTALLQRLHEEKADWVIYVVDTGQSVHFKTCMAAAVKAGFYNPTIHRVDHVGFGVVLGEDKKKFKTRSGETVRLVDLLDEGLERSKKRLLEKGRDKELSEDEFKTAQEAVAYGCIKYADLSHTRTNDYIFSFDKMLDDKGNTAVYLLYAYTRIRSIIRAAGYTSQQLAKLAENEPLKLDHPTEWNLASAVCRLPDILLRIQNDYLLHNLCDYLYELSCIFTNFYDACYCIERNRETGAIMKIHTHRLMLCEATSKVMKCCFDIIGITAVERM